MTILETLVAATLACATPEPAVLAPADTSYARLFAAGRTFADFLAAAERRKEQWERNYRAAVVPDALLTRARGAAGPWKLLVVAVDGCSDSVNTIPYLARLVDQLAGVEMRIVGSDIGRAVMDAHRTPDGRGATPTVILLGPDWSERGAWIERPTELQSWIIGQKGVLSDDAVFERKMQWYDTDQGQKTLEEIVVMFERASARTGDAGASGR